VRPPAGHGTDGGTDVGRWEREAVARPGRGRQETRCA